MNPAALLLISQGVGEAMRLALQGFDLISKLANDELTAEEAEAAWEDAQLSYQAGRDVWDAAGGA